MWLKSTLGRHNTRGDRCLRRRAIASIAAQQQTHEDARGRRDEDLPTTATHTHRDIHPPAQRSGTHIAQ